MKVIEDFDNLVINKEFNRVLIIAYYFPPMGLSGVQRVAKLVKYLPEHSWKPTVLTINPGGYFAFDDGLLEEVEKTGVEIVRTGSSDPTQIFGKKKKVKMPQGFRRKLLSRISQFFFIPDNKKGWRKQAIPAGLKILAEHDFDAILSSGPPMTAHLIGAELSRKTGVPLITDFRDDWMGDPRLWFATPYHRSRHQKLENSVMAQSSKVTTYNRYIKENIIRRHFGAEGFTRVQIVPHGYDSEDFNVQPAPRTPGKFRMVYSGIFYDAQTPDYFLKALKDLITRRPDIKDEIEAVFVGMIPDKSQKLISKLDIGSLIIDKGYVDHLVAVKNIKSADLLWMTVGRQKGGALISTGKLYEYFGTRKPILALVPEGAVSSILKDYGQGTVVAPDDILAISKAVEVVWENWKHGRLMVPNEPFVRQFERKEVARVMADVLKSTLTVV